MNIDEIMTLVKAVSDYNLTSFELEEGNVKISLKREKEMPQIVTVGAPAMDAASAAVSAQMTVSYTHLDVYKRQIRRSGPGFWRS